MEDLSGTREIWEDVIGEFPKMWMQDTYEGYEGKFWSLPPRKILPKPYVKPHPPMWYAAGNTSSYEMTARKGLGVLGFSVQSLEECEAVMKVYKGAIANAEPVGAFVNDNIMITSAAYVRETRDEAVKAVVDSRMTYLQSNVYRYHDTFPHPEWVPKWPELIPDVDEETARAMIGTGGVPDRRSRRRARGLPALGERGRRPARVRHRPRHARGHARDDPAPRRARDPEDRHRPRAPHEQAAGRRRLSQSASTASA